MSNCPQDICRRSWPITKQDGRFGLFLPTVVSAQQTTQRRWSLFVWPQCPGRLASVTTEAFKASRLASCEITSSSCCSPPFSSVSLCFWSLQTVLEPSTALCQSFCLSQLSFLSYTRQLSAHHTETGGQQAYRYIKIFIHSRTYVCQRSNTRYKVFTLPSVTNTWPTWIMMWCTRLLYSQLTRSRCKGFYHSVVTKSSSLITW